MRISTQMMYEQNMRGITDSQSRWLSYGEQMSTGKRVNRPSDDPIAASRSVVLEQAPMCTMPVTPKGSASPATIFRKRSRCR